MLALSYLLGINSFRCLVGTGKITSESRIEYLSAKCILGFEFLDVKIRKHFLKN